MNRRPSLPLLVVSLFVPTLALAITIASGSGTASDPFASAPPDPYGVPPLTGTREVYSSVFRQDVIASLPERQNLTRVRPQLIADATTRNLHLSQDAEVSVSFVHEGAGYRNVVGVYPFATGSPPQRRSEVAHHVVFPNASFRGSGGNLRMGDTVSLGTISSGTSLGFWLNANGWKGSRGVTGGNWSVYSSDVLNEIADPGLQRQTILLRDPDAGRFVVAFEDIRRDRGGDQDFNDVILTVQVTPFSAVEAAGIPDLVVAQDVDGDGVNNGQDDYPDDPARAFRVEVPGSGLSGILAFEDLWPYRGDYDFNDLVVKYSFEEARNAAGKVVDLTCRYRVVARGASYHNGLMIRLPIDPSEVASVTRRFDAFEHEPWALRADQSQATAEVFADAHLMLTNAPGYAFANTEPGSPQRTGRQVEVRFTFATPLDPARLGAAPYDTYLERGGVEVHLPGFQPSDTCDLNLVGTGDDGTKLGTDYTFRTPWGQPWVLHLSSGEWAHPHEKVSIEQAYGDFIPWVQSRGANKATWYLNARPGKAWGR